MVINRHIGMQTRIGTDYRTHTHNTVGSDPSSGTDYGMVFNHGSCINPSGRINFSRYGNRSMQVNAAGKLSLQFFNHLQGKSKPGIGIGSNDHGARRFITVNGFFIFFAKNNNACLAVFYLMDKFRIG